MLIVDCEIYRNYFLLCVRPVGGDKITTFEMYPGHDLDPGVVSILSKETSVGFNSANYDLPLIAAAVRGVTNERLKELSDQIIVGEAWWKLGLTVPRKWDHIDIIQLAIGQSSLKIYGGRLHAPTLQDLPIEPNASISVRERAMLREYCANDLDLTELLYTQLKPQIELRTKMSKQYGVDLRSKSDAQIAEAVIRNEMESLGATVCKPNKVGKYFFYRDPGIFDFKGPELRSLFQNLLDTEFTLSKNGSVEIPPLLKMPVAIGKSRYQMGVGGLHSCEKSQYIEPSRHEFLIDMDVTSYYPSIILNQCLAPEHLGQPFLDVFRTLVDRRVRAKKSGDKVESDTLKITINGTFGKLGSKYSFLYSPGLMLQTTMTGQLAILMLIERMELAGVRCVSANTDGVVLTGPNELMRTVEEVSWEWSLSTGYELETTPYRLIASRDVNNYFAITTDGKVKGKGVFAGNSLAKNPDGQIVFDAVINRIANGTSPMDTIKGCRDVRKFVTLRRVTGGATWGGEPIGKAIRYYHSTSVPMNSTITYLKNGNKVPNSDGTRPLMTLTDQFPEDIDYDVYNGKAQKLLKEVGYL